MNKKLIKNVLLISASVSFFIFSFILFIDSRVKKDGSYETTDGKNLYMFKYKFNSDHMIGMLFGIVLIILAIYLFYVDYKNKEINPIVKPISFGIISFIGCAYNLKNFASPIIEDDAKFKDVLSSFYGFIVFSILLIYFIFTYLISKKELNK